MRVEFRQGVPVGCTEWLWKNVGRGNLNKPKDGSDYDWFYERVEKEINPQPFGDATVEYISTITVKNPKLATWFILQWAS